MWYVFAGMGTQWPNMGRDLMEMDVFRRSISKSDAVLQKFDIHLIDMLMNSGDETFNDTLNSFVCIVAIQVT